MSASWRIASALGATATDGLLGEINAGAPGRSKASDGGIGDANHSSRTSDHNPCDCHRVVCARDFTHDPKGGFDAHAFANWLAARVVSAEPRVKYIISNKRICSGQGQSYPAGVWRPYSGSNPHTAHAHVSVRHGGEHFDAPASWGWEGWQDATTPEPIGPPDAPMAFPCDAPPFPLAKGHWYGPEDADPRNHSGFYAIDRPWVLYCAQTLYHRGWRFIDPSVDVFTDALAAQIVSWQRFAGLNDDGLIGPETFTALHTYPVVCALA